MVKHPNRILWTAILVAWLFDFLFWEKSPGISFSIFVGVAVAVGFILARGENIKPDRRAWWLLVPILIFSIGSFTRKEPFTTFTNYLMVLVAMGMIANTFLGGRWLNYSLSDFVASFFYLSISAISKPFEILTKKKSKSADVQYSEPTQLPTWRRILPILRGLLIAIPIVGVFASLLASADPIFESYLEDFIRIFNIKNLPEYFFRGVYILILGYVLTGTYLHAYTNDKEVKLIGEEKPWIPKFLGFTETAIILGSVESLFVVFVGIQFRYFFGGQSNIKIDGFTYAEYARRGFSELVVVAFFSLLLFLGLSAISRHRKPNQRKTFSGMGIGLVVLVVIILVSAFQRLVLYEQTYGFTRLRTYSHLFMVWLGILLTVVIILEIVNKQRSFALAALFISFGFVLTLNIINVDKLIVYQNVLRVSTGEELDTSYFQTLSTDATPAIMQAYKNNNLLESERSDLAAILGCKLAEMAKTRENYTWSSYHWADARAWKLLQDNKDDFNTAQVYRNPDGTMWVMMNDIHRPCYGSVYEYD